ncbi:MAG: transglutaminase family protein [Armatimonadetes bacterium]|nr:transglutaminase family protein [Armatimonadota bacterium]
MADAPDLLRLCTLAAEGLAPVDLDGADRQIGFLAYLVGQACEADTAPARVAALRRVLAEEEGFAGPIGDIDGEVDDPRHLLLPHVVADRRGLPIALATVYLAVAQRLGWPIEGLDFPTHFLLRDTGAEGILILDPCNPGVSLDREDCRQLLRPAFGRLPEAAFDRFCDMRLAAVVTPRIIAARMLKQLEGSYLRREMYDEVRLTIQKLLLLDQAAIAEMRDLGEIHHMLGEHRQALTCLRLYLDEAPYAADRVLVQRVVRQIEQQVSGA